ncbi:MAG: hypothetical protein IPK27_07795 [Rhodanobacteraceae bacterium]|nr:hypothetical protein [Rhodanobacteraceae bacterium]
MSCQILLALLGVPAFAGPPPAFLRRLGTDAAQWTDRVRAVKPEQGFCRVIGSEGALVDKAAEIGQRWLRGLGVARSLAN